MKTTEGRRKAGSTVFELKVRGLHVSFGNGRRASIIIASGIAGLLGAIAANWIH